MEQSNASKSNMAWHEKIVFLIPFLLPCFIALGLGLESLNDRYEVPYGDFRDPAMRNAQ